MTKESPARTRIGALPSSISSDARQDVAELPDAALDRAEGPEA